MMFIGNLEYQREHSNETILTNNNNNISMPRLYSVVRVCATNLQIVGSNPSYTSIYFFIELYLNHISLM